MPKRRRFRKRSRAGHRSSDRMADLADGHCFSLHEADADADTVGGRESGRFEGGLAELRHDTATRDADPRYSTRRDPSKLDGFLHDARRSRLRSIQQFARTLTRDIEAVRHTIAESWSSGQAEGQINRLKTLKRAVYGRAGIELSRARMLPLDHAKRRRLSLPTNRYGRTDWGHPPPIAERAARVTLCPCLRARPQDQQIDHRPALETSVPNPPWLRRFFVEVGLLAQRTGPLATGGTIEPHRCL
jgi:hypothetical protein